MKVLTDKELLQLAYGRFPLLFKRTETPQNDPTALLGYTYLQSAAKAVIDRWDSPNWKDEIPTAVLINRLRIALQQDIDAKSNLTKDNQCK